MATPLNLYATKVFAEQPLGLWALDDKADYVSFLPAQDQDLSTWTSTGVTDIVSPNNLTFGIPTAPFPELEVNGIISDTQNNGLVTFTSPFQLQDADVDLEKETFSFGFYIYSFSKIVNVRLGFRYFDTNLQELCETLTSCPIKPAGLSTALSWAMVSETFVLPKFFEDLELFIEVNYAPDQTAYEFAINAITAGQWAEEFQLKSTGTNLIDVPANIAIPQTKGLEAQPYGFQTNNGYYLAEQNFLSARNLGVPLVYGSRNSTYITPKENSPSLILPAFGFLNRGGQFNRLTAEFWIKIQSRAIEPRKIFGPIASDDGLYVEGPFLKLKIGRQVGSHYVREWDRPMLIDIRVSPSSATLILNGEQVISIELNPRSYRFVSSKQEGKDQDWLGFYAYEDVPVIQLDCVAVYPYEVSAIVAKRKWVYGQGVQVPADIKGADNTLSVFVDYPFSKYAKNYYFPSSSRWSSGSVENLTIEDDAIFPTNHALPELRFSDKTEEEWLQDLKISQDPENPVITLKPNEQWQNTQGHLFFNNLNFLSTQTRSFYGVFESEKFSDEEQTLFEITNSINSNTIRIYTKGDALSYETSEIKKVNAPSGFTRYRVRGFPHAFRNDQLLDVYGVPEIFESFKWSVVNVFSNEEFEIEAETGITEVVIEGSFILSPSLKIILESTVYYSFITKLPSGQSREKIFYTSPGQKTRQRYFVGLDIPRFVRSEGKELANFIGTRQNLAVYVGGTVNLDQTFDGKIHRVGFATERNLNKIQHLFNSEGFPVDYVNVFESFGPNIFDAGSQYFGNDIDPFGNAITPPPEFWSLILDGGDPYDFSVITAEEHIASYTLVPKNYFDKFVIDVASESYWEDYVPLSYFSKRVQDARGNLRPEVTFIQFNIDYPVIRRFEGETFDTSQAFVKTYVAFQPIRGGSNETSSFFTKTERLNKSRVVRPDSDWLNTKYEVVNGTVIYPPVDVNPASLSLTVYVEMVVDGININPIRIRSVQLSSQSYGTAPNKIGTRFGTDLVPFSRAKRYFNYKNAPPLAIYKGSTPYLYNTSESGIELRIPYSNKNIQGISMPINRLASQFFKVGSLQMSLKYGEDLFPEVPIKIFEIAHKAGQINFFLASDSPNRKRGQVYAVNQDTGRLQGNLMFFNNGIPSKRPILYPNTWSVLGISFPSFLDFGESVGALRITSPIMFNNISYFQTTEADDEERFGFRQWFAVRSQLGEAIDWGFWAGKEEIGGDVIDILGLGTIWQEVLRLSTVPREELDASNIYNIFTGTERIISDVDMPMPIAKYQYKIFRNLRWSPTTIDPV